MLSNIQATQPVAPSLPSESSKILRISPTVRLRLSVKHFAEHGHAAGAVAFVDHFFEAGPFEFAGAAFDGPLDVLLGHAHGLGVVDGVAEPQVGVGVAAAVLGRDDDRLGQFAPEFAALGVDQRFLVFNARPM